MAQLKSSNSRDRDLASEIESSVTNRQSFQSRWSELLDQARKIEPPINQRYTFTFGKDAEINFNLITR